jgi:dienelactone hydrolase
VKVSLFFISLLCTLLLLFGSASVAAQANAAASANGKIIEQARYEMPAYDQIGEVYKSLYTREAVEKIRTAPDMEVFKIRYMSGGLKIAGFIYKPRATAGKKYPAIILNRGGLADGLIGPANYNYLYEMHRYAAAGFVVLASQYRGGDGAGGKDEAGGADTDDVLNLIETARSLEYVDTERLFMWGYSRGAIMTLQALRRGAPVRAAAIVGAPTDYAQLEHNPFFIQFARSTFPDFEARKEEHFKSRSAVLWADEINVPVLILQGGADVAVPPTQAMALAQKLEEHGRLYELVIYAKDEHPIFRNMEDRLNRTIDWFKRVRRISISQPLAKIIEQQGVEAAIKQYYDLKKGESERYDWGEPELNRLGYILLNANRVKEAIEIFKLNVTLYPQGFNTYDSLGEAYLASGNRDEAIRNYKKSLELNPQNTNATNVLRRINAEQ